VMSREGGQEYLEWIKASESRMCSARRGSLVALHARGCQVVSEIICLMENGFADGAFARWRTLHEITIVATILADGSEDLANRYLAHECVEAKRSMDYFRLHFAELGYEEPTKEEIARIEADFEKCLDVYGYNFGSQYGWALSYLGLKKANLRNLEEAAGQISSRSNYIFAGHNVHATPKGINFRLGLLEQGEALLAGMSNVGFGVAATNAAHSFVQLNIAIMRDRWDFDTLVISQMLLALRNEVPAAFDEVQKRIEARAQALVGSLARSSA